MDPYKRRKREEIFFEDEEESYSNAGNPSSTASSSSSSSSLSSSSSSSLSSSSSSSTSSSSSLSSSSSSSALSSYTPTSNLQLFLEGRDIFPIERTAEEKEREKVLVNAEQENLRQAMEFTQLSGYGKELRQLQFASKVFSQSMYPGIQKEFTQDELKLLGERYRKYVSLIGTYITHTSYATVQRNFTGKLHVIRKADIARIITKELLPIEYRSFYSNGSYTELRFAIYEFISNKRESNLQFTPYMQEVIQKLQFLLNFMDRNDNTIPLQVQNVSRGYAQEQGRNSFTSSDLYYQRYIYIYNPISIYTNLLFQQNSYDTDTYFRFPEVYQNLKLVVEILIKDGSFIVGPKNIFDVLIFAAMSNDVNVVKAYVQFLEKKFPSLIDEFKATESISSLIQEYLVYTDKMNLPFQVDILTLLGRITLASQGKLS